MKRRSHRLLQRKRVDIDSSSTMRRISTTVGVAGSAALRSQDGYDWLREIKRFQARCAQPST
ncbi:MAG: hypothetical protein WC617_19685 [Rhodanobacter sp.]|jgi:hypothetical protein